MKILFLCRSNVTRSQMAEAFFNAYSENNKAESAALENPAEKMHKLVVKVMAEKGIDISKNKPKKLIREMIDNADKIILMDKDLLELAEDIPRERLKIWDVEDIIHSEDEKYTEEFRKVRDIVEKEIKELIKNNFV